MKHKVVLFIVGFMMVLNCSFAQCPPGNVVTLKSFVTQASCHAGSDGAVTIAVLTGTAPYTYIWSNGATTASNIELTAGTYGVTVTDALGCQSVLNNIIVTEPGPFIYNVTLRNETCFGSCDGSLDFFLEGGTAPYTYVWTNPTNGDTLGTGEDLANLCQGIYRLSVRDANGCTGGIFYLIASPPQINIAGVVTNVTCPGGTNGSIVTTVTGGTGIKVYQWSTGETSKNLTNKPAGTYTITATDVNGCTAARTFTITQPDSIIATASITQPVICNKQNNGAIDITVTGGTPPYVYSWSNGATTEDLSNMAAGQYCVTITDSRGCVSRQFCFTIAEPQQIQLSADITPITCSGDSLGAIDLTITGGTAPFTIVWSNGATTEDISNLTAGTYSVVVTDSNGCEQTGSFTITAPIPMIINVGVVNASCRESNGAVFISVSGGTPPFTYAWSNGGTAASIDNVPLGTYTVTVTDANGCEATENTYVNNITDIVLTRTLVEDVCGSAGVGSIDLSVTGGTAPYTYNWSNGATTQDISNLTAGVYIVTVTDADSCGQILEVIITENPGFNLTLSSTSSVCNGAGGTATVTTVGSGTAPFTIAWSNGQSTNTITNLSQGIYNVTVTDANGCSVAGSVVVNDAVNMSIGVGVQDATCAVNDGALTISVTGGTPPFSYQWSTGDTTAAISNLTAGDYSATVTDANGCAQSFTQNVQEPLPIIAEADRDIPLCPGEPGSIDITILQGFMPYTFDWSNGDTTEDLTNVPGETYTVTIGAFNGCTLFMSIDLNDPDPIVITPNITPVTCEGGSDGELDISVTGGTPPYTFVWSNGATTEDITGLTAGIYTVVVTDSNGCTESTSFTVATDNILVVSVGITQPACGESNGSATVSVSGGTPPFTFNWSNGGTGATIDSIGAGAYTVTVTDANGCSTVETVAVSNANSGITITGTVTNTVCGTTNTGSITIAITGGTAPYTILWSTGGTGLTVNGLGAGTYTVTVTDSSGCIAVASFTIGRDSGLTLNITSTNATCGNEDGTASVVVTGGTSPYTFAWSNGQTTTSISGLAAGFYQVTVTDANGCTETASVNISDINGPQFTITETDITCATETGSLSVTNITGNGPFTIRWSTGETTATITNLNAGTYVVTVTSADTCETIASAEITTPDGIVLNAAPTAPTCPGAADGSIDVTVTGGVPPYTYAWNSGATTEDLSGLNGGTFSVTATDANGCSATTTITIEEPLPIIVTADSVTQPVCNGDSSAVVIISVTGGEPPYTYVWSNGDTTQNLTDVPLGQYCVTVTDANGCTSTPSCFTVDNPDSLQVTPNITQPTCNGDSTGSISVTVSGGIPPYDYEWSTGDSSTSLTGLPAGSYTLTVTDSLGCQSIQTLTVTEPDSITITVSNQSNVTCNGADDGSITVSVSGGTAPYDYDWSNGESTPTIDSLEPGTYTVTVTDANGCSAVSSAITITEPDSLNITAAVTQPTCTLPGSIDVTVTGGTAPYTYIWSDSSTLQDIPVVTTPGTYSVTVTDANGCTASATVTVNDAPQMQVSITVTQELRCNQDTTGELCALGSGGTAPYTYEWSTNDTTPCITNVPAGVYSVTATDANGCTAAQTQFILDDPDAIVVTPTVIVPVTCNGDTDGSITVTATGGVAPYVYQWSNGDFGNVADQLPAGPVTVTVTDANGCTVANTFNIPGPPPFDFSQTAVTQVTCDTATDGSISLVVTGGTPNYTYEWENGFTGTVRNNLGEGTYSVTVTDAIGCTGTASFTLDGPRCNLPPVAVLDTTKMYVCLNQALNISVTENDYDPDGDSIAVTAIIAQPFHGLATLNADQTITYTPHPNFIGIDTFAYQLCETNVTPGLCDTGYVIIVVLPCRPNIHIPNGFSPNGDGTNDNFEIPGIEFFPNNELLIFNRWGNKVREFHGYKNEWTGTNEDEEELPDGTYYYILKLNDGAGTTYTGYVVIHRGN